MLTRAVIKEPTPSEFKKKKHDSQIIMCDIVLTLRDSLKIEEDDGASTFRIIADKTTIFLNANSEDDRAEWAEVIVFVM